MDKNTKILKYIYLGIFWIFLINTAGSSFCFGDSVSNNKIEEGISSADFKDLKVVATGAELPFGKQPYESEEKEEEEKEEEEKKEESKNSSFFNLVNNDSPPLQEFISSEYQDSHLSTPQKKRYLLFHSLKIFC
ncbi:MAG: hypothetical protein ACI920_004135 [Saprospiraceae bacterium]|jgi:hypothetical protein